MCRALGQALYVVVPETSREVPCRLRVAGEQTEAERDRAPPLRQALLWSERQRVATSPSSKTTSHFIRRTLHKETRSACPVGGGPRLSTRQDPRLQGPHARRSSVSSSAWQGPD